MGGRGESIETVLLFPAARESVTFKVVVEAGSVYGIVFMVIVCSEGLEFAKLIVAV